MPWYFWIAILLGSLYGAAVALGKAVSKDADKRWEHVPLCMGRLACFLATNEGQEMSFGIHQRHDGTWMVSGEWGHEAPDSPMVGSAIYGHGGNLSEALHMALDDTRISRDPATWVGAHGAG